MLQGYFKFRLHHEGTKNTKGHEELREGNRWCSILAAVINLDSLLTHEDETLSGDALGRQPVDSDESRWFRSGGFALGLTATTTLLNLAVLRFEDVSDVAPADFFGNNKWFFWLLFAPPLLALAGAWIAIDSTVHGAWSRVICFAALGLAIATLALSVLLIWITLILPSD